MALFLGASVMAVGAIPPGIALLFSLGASVLLGLWLFQHPAQSPPLQPVSQVFFLLSLWSLLQCVPLPLPLLARLSPGSADIWRQALLTADGIAPTWAPLSLAPEQTLLEAAKWGGYASLSLLGAWWARHRGLSHLLWMVLALTISVGVVTVFHGLLDAQTIFGIYKPIHHFPRWTRGPLLNVNHLSAYLSLGFFSALALLFSERAPSTQRGVLLGLGAASLVVGVVALASRAAVVALALGGLLVPLVLLEGTRGKRIQQRQQIQQKMLVTLVGIFGVGVALALYGFGEGISKGLGEKNFSKLQTARDSLGMIREFWLTGVGRGAFEGVFFRYKSPGDYEAWSHPENLLIQWSSEWGIPVALLTLGILLRTIFKASGWRASRSASLLMLGLAIMGLHNLLDFNMEVAAIGGLFAVLLGAFVGAYPPANIPRPHTPPQQRRFAFAVATSTVLVAALAWSKKPEIPLQERNEAHDILKRASRSEEVLELDTFRAWMRRYPADPYFPAAAGLLYSRMQPAKALRWLGWALKRGPNLGVVRLGLADALARAGYKHQALLEVRLAVDRDPSSLSRATSLAMHIASSLGDLWEATPAPPHDLPFLEGVARYVPPHTELFASLRKSVLEKQPCAGALQESLLREQMEAAQAETPPCDGPAGRASCKGMIEESLSKLRSCPELGELNEQFQAEFLWTFGNRLQALQMYEKSCAQATDLARCLQHLAERAAVLPDLDRLKRATKLVLSRRCQEPLTCAKTWAWAARLFERANDLPAALSALEKASEQDPGDLNLRYQQALLSQRMNATERATLILRQILARSPDYAPARSKLAELQATPSGPLPPRKDRK